MNISYNWLRDYLPFDLTPREVAAALTAIGLETGSVEEIESIKGGMEGLVVGKVLTCIKHPNSDHLHITTVDIGEDAPRQIVCGAPNVAAGQKVVVATTGTTLYHGDEKIVIKKSKIRGEESNGMICAEDEIGLGTSHDGIIVLPEDTQIGMSAKEYYHIENDYVLEVDITPNRVDGTSHFGVARDLAAYLNQTGKHVELQRPSIDSFQIDDTSQAIRVTIENQEACLRYSGVTIRGVTVKESPDWLKNRLTVIGLRPINNIVDITNFVLHELGQPLHAFDASKIKDDKIVVRTTQPGTVVITLDGVSRSLTNNDLTICNAEEPMCIAGVFGGLDSGVTEHTTDVFLESACFHPAWIRKTARRFALHTDSSFRFERGVDPNQTVYALKRAALLIKELAGGKITDAIQDVYPAEVKPYPVTLTYKKINSLIGNEIPANVVKNILSSLEMEILDETQEKLTIRVPVYRFDVRREVDVIEDILRIYGYNNIDLNNRMQLTLSHQTATDRSYQLENLISEQLCGAGFNEILNNSLTRRSLYEGLSSQPADQTVMLENPLSADLNGMRQTLLFGGLQSVAFNINHKYKNIRFFEFGNCYSYLSDIKKDSNTLASYCEEYFLGIWMTGKQVENSWTTADMEMSAFELKAVVENILQRLGIDINSLTQSIFSNDIFSNGIELQTRSGKCIGKYGIVNRKIIKSMDIENDVFFAELSWDKLFKLSEQTTISFTDIYKFPEVKRDLALLLDQEVTFDAIRKVAFESERHLLKRVNLFDVYEGQHLPTGKKSYAVSFYLQDERKTLTDMQIDLIMSKIEKNLESRLGAKRR
ncbi:MAG: phenylalanine--tRNA ligase subunit beta [Tannerella sp.]|jgi:phenylalanyl-tRNA synthetase beta chain|nr:phenylalanine--tRNA ligase subunit beta [Tannerella sp.]